MVRRGVFRARGIVFDFRPIKLDSAHRPASARIPNRARLSAGWIRTFGSAAERNIPFSISPEAPARSPSLSPRERAPRDSEKYYLSASWHINSPYAMIIKVSRDTHIGPTIYLLRWGARVYSVSRNSRGSSSRPRARRRLRGLHLCTSFSYPRYPTRFPH